MARSRNRNQKMVPGVEPAIDALKYEIATNLGIQDIIDNDGWTALSTLDAGNIGGAVQQIINELGQRQLIAFHKSGRISEIAHLSSNTKPAVDLTKHRLSDEVKQKRADYYNQTPENPAMAGMDASQFFNKPIPRQTQVEQH